MKTAIISDIHSNLEALNSVLDYLNTEEKVDEIVCLGDIVGYGANPDECLNKIFSLTDNICMGNHDYAVLYPDLENYMNLRAVTAIKWTRDHVGEKIEKEKNRFKESIIRDNIIFVHSNPIDPYSWDYVYDYEAELYLNTMSYNLCFIGHTHYPGIFCETKIPLEDDQYYLLDKNSKTIVNVGSVGQPRDRDIRACFVIFDNINWKMKYIKLNYDVNKARDKIIEAGLPRELGERLLIGV